MHYRGEPLTNRSSHSFHHDFMALKNKFKKLSSVIPPKKQRMSLKGNTLGVDYINSPHHLSSKISP